ncbi:efflux RND transporter permease subunit [candidate division KSB1 bacterium]
MFLSKLSVTKPVLTAVIILFFVVLGLYSYLGLSVDLFPEVDIPYVTVQTIYPGAGPAEIETLISKPIEEAVGSINGVETITSSSVEGASIVVVEFQLEIDIDIAAMDVKDKLDGIIGDLPDDVEKPIIMKLDIGAQPIMNLAVHGPRPLNEIYKLTDDIIKPELSKIAGLASINIVGGKEREILIGVQRDKLKAHNISITDVIGGIAGANLDMPSGHITEKWKEFPIRVTGEFESVDEISKMKILVQDHEPLRLEDVADVVDTFEEQRDWARYNDKTSVGIGLVKRSDANVVKVAEEVKKELKAIEKQLPPDVELSIAEDESKFIKDSINEVINNMIIGILLTALVLFIFLHDWKSTLIAALAMPSSIISTFILLRFAGFTINFMTLMALAISVGVLVTNSIVVLENIFRHINLGEDAKTASERGTSEIAVAVAASTLTNIVVFTPIAFMGGIVGQFFIQFGLTVAFSTIFSLLVSFTMTPMLAAIVLRESQGEKRGFDMLILLIYSVLLLTGLSTALILAGTKLFGTSFVSVILPFIISIFITLLVSKKMFSANIEVLRKKTYFKASKFLIKVILFLIAGVIVIWTLNYLFNTVIMVIIISIIILLFIFNKMFGILGKFNKWWEASYSGIQNDYRTYLEWTLNNSIIVLTAIVVLFFGSLYFFKYVGSEFFAKTDRGMVSIEFELPAGSSLEETDKAMLSAEKIISGFPEVKTIYTEVGRRPADITMGSGEGVQLGNMRVEMVGKDNRDLSVFEFVDILRNELAVIPAADIYVTDESGMGGGGAPLAVEITGDDLDALNNIGSKVMNIAKDVPGITDLRSSWKLGVPEIRVVPDRKRMEDRGVSISTLASVLRSSIQGQVASKFRVGDDEYDIRVRYADQYIENADNIRDIKIKSGEQFIPITEIARIVEERGPVQITRKDKKRLVSIFGNSANRSIGEIVADLRERTASLDLPEGTAINFGGDTEMQEESFVELYNALILAIILTYLLLAAILESFFHPVIIMITLPLALIGVVFSLIMTGKSINILSLMAIIMLVGIVVNNAILILDYINVLRNRGVALKEAVLEASQTRLKPIIMANLATILGMLPLALELGEGAEMRSPMAIVQIGGLATAVFFTLFIVPLIFYIFEKIKAK